MLPCLSVSSSLYACAIFAVLLVKCSFWNSTLLKPLLLFHKDLHLQRDCCCEHLHFGVNCNSGEVLPAHYLSDDTLNTLCSSSTCDFNQYKLHRPIQKLQKYHESMTVLFKMTNFKIPTPLGIYIIITPIVGVFK